MIALCISTPLLLSSASSPDINHNALLSSDETWACPSKEDWSSGVWGPDRLSLLSACKSVSGTVVHTLHPADGDVHMTVAVDAPYQYLLNNANEGLLVVELMPRDGGHLPAPEVGAHVVLTGAWVLDTDHGWNEIHPVWAESIDGGPLFESGPQYGGSFRDSSYETASEDCRTEGEEECVGYSP